MQKWSRRHTSLVRAVGLGLVVAVAALAASTVWAWHKQKQTDEQREAAVNNAAEADQQRQRADENFRKSVKVVTGLLEEVDRNQAGLNQERVSLASQAAIVIQGLLAGDTPTDPESRLLIAQAHEGLGTAQKIRGEVIEAARHYAEARDLCAQLAAEFPGEARFERERQRIHRRLKDLAPLSVGELAVGKGLHEVAARAFRDALRINQIAGADINGSLTLIERVACHYELGDSLRALGQRQEAEQAYGEALVECDRLAQEPEYKEYPPLLVPLEFRVRVLACRGLLVAESGRLKEAEADLRQALDLVDRLKPDDRETVLLLVRDLARVRSGLGNILWATDRRPEATELFRQAEQEWRKAKSTPIRDNQLAWFLATCPDPQFRKPKEAVELAQQAVKKTPETEPWIVHGVVDYGPWQFRRTLGVALYRAGDWKAAVKAPLQAAGHRARDDSIAYDFVRAMTEWQLGHKDVARSIYAAAVVQMKRNRPDDEELRRFREEAAHLLGIEPDHD
jgi:tetratricopeptide (TPR) repeat protein